MRCCCDARGVIFWITAARDNASPVSTELAANAEETPLVRAHPAFWSTAVDGISSLDTRYAPTSASSSRSISTLERRFSMLGDTCLDRLSLGTDLRGIRECLVYPSLPPRL